MPNPLRRMLAISGLAIGSMALFPSSMATADVITPAGACSASGQWVNANVTRISTDYVPTDVIVIPQKDVGKWQGHEDNKPIRYVGPKRAISGKVAIELPFNIAITVWHWSGTMSARYSNEGQESYNLPSELIGLKIALSGYEDDSGQRVCSGSVLLEVAGSKTSNPIAFGALAATILLLAGLVASGLRKSKLAYDDINP